MISRVLQRRIDALKHHYHHLVELPWWHPKRWLTAFFFPKRIAVELAALPAEPIYTSENIKPLIDALLRDASPFKYFFKSLRAFLNSPDMRVYAVLHKRGLLTGEEGLKNFNIVGEGPHYLERGVTALDASGKLSDPSRQQHFDALLHQLSQGFRKTQEITREDFVQAIRDFKRVRRGKLKELLKSPESLQAFWANPIIQGYLARSNTGFKDKHPNLKGSKHKDDHFNSDHYELKVYKYLPDTVLYRDGSITTPKFYNSGTWVAKDIFTPLFQSLSDGASGIESCAPADIYEISDDVHKRFFTGLSSSRFILHPNCKDDHASTCVTILDPLTQKVLATIFINSWDSNDYYEYSKERFWHENSKYYRVADGGVKERVKSFLARLFSIDFADSTLSNHPPAFLEDKQEGVVLALNCGANEFRSKAYDAIKETSQTVYSLRCEKDAEPCLDVTSQKPRTPFINASHHLQQASDDKNCVLYSLNFVRGIAEMLKQPAIAERVFALAYKLRMENDTNAEKDLMHIFQEELKAYLPYYQAGKTRTSKEIEDFHLRQRWKMGGFSLFMRQRGSMASGSAALSSQLGLFALDEKAQLERPNSESNAYFVCQ